MLFLESSEVIFRFAIALLNMHKEELLKRDNFEDIMDYIKTSLPQIDAATLDKITKDVRSRFAVIGIRKSFFITRAIFRFLPWILRSNYRNIKLSTMFCRRKSAQHSII